MELNYTYTLEDGRREAFRVCLDDETLALANLEPEPPPWTALDYHTCPNCPGSRVVGEHCPLAVSLVGLVTRLGNVLSYERLEVEVHSPERTIIRTTSAQEGISSLMGLLVATSGCPHTAFFRPMARFHLPFSSTDETIYRAVSMYCLAQYFRHHQGLSADMDFKGLLAIYREVEQVNKAMANRLRAANREDSSVNAIVLLDMFAKTMPVAIEDSLYDLWNLYAPYLTEYLGPGGDPCAS